MSDTPPVILLIYRRPAETALVRAALRAARPSHLMIVADGPRAGCPGDPEAVAAATRAASADVTSSSAAVQSAAHAFNRITTWALSWGPSTNLR